MIVWRVVLSFAWGMCGHGVLPPDENRGASSYGNHVGMMDMGTYPVRDQRYEALMMTVKSQRYTVFDVR